MAQEQIKCPACPRRFTERGVRLHFRKALEGWDPIWDSSQPHSKWAQSKGIKVIDIGTTFDFDKLNNALDEYLSSR